MGPAQSMTGIHVIEGRPEVSANTIAAAIQRSDKYAYRVLDNTAEKCVIEFFEKTANGRDSLGKSEFTLADAKRAGLEGRNVWKKYPKAMLFARAISQGYRMFCPSVFSLTVYAEGEISGEVGEEPRRPKAPPSEDVIDVDHRPASPRTGQPAHTDLARGGESMIVYEDWRELLGEPLAMKIRGKMASDEDVQGILIKYCKDAHFAPARFTRPQLAVLGAVAKVAGKRYAEEIVALGCTAEQFDEASKAVGVVGPLKTLSAWDRREIRDWLTKAQKKSAKKAPADRDEHGAQRYDVEPERITKAHARAIEAREDSEVWS